MPEVSKAEIIRAHVYYWKNFAQLILNVCRTYVNYPVVLRKVLRGKFPVELIMRNGKHVFIDSFNAMYVLTFTKNMKEVHCDVENDLVRLSSKMSASQIIIHGGINNGDIVHGFLKEDYGKLPVKNKTVIDIGANIGDTPIYFALNGATKVIGLEPFPKNYETATKNILENKLSDKITILLAGCASKEGSVTINPDYESNHESRLIEFNVGKKIPLLTLQDIIEQQDIPNNSILKMDCEGCEYDIISGTPKELLQKFSHIQLEYHAGYKTIKKKLEDCGFNVSITKPVATDVLHTLLESIRKSNSKATNNSKSEYEESHMFKKRHRIGYMGFIFAERNFHKP